MKILYFAWLRERVGVSSEELALPVGLKTVEDLVGWLKGREERYAAAFADMRPIRVALDQEQAELSQSLDGVSEVAFFPPVTGG